MVVDFSNVFVIIFLAGTILSFLINHFLEFADYRSRCKNGGILPPEIADFEESSVFDTEKLQKIVNYENSKYFVWIFSSTLNLILQLCLILFGFYPFVFEKICLITGFPDGVLNSTVCFFLFLILTSIPDSILSIPFELYEEFVLEKKFGFSKMTLKLWIFDNLKSFALSLIMSALLSFASSAFFIAFPKMWWLILAAVLILFTFIMQVIYPKFIAPLFNKFTPLEEGELKNKITEILNKTGFVSGGLFVMDASKRSGHSNAYFSGFGKSKRIVLYDTLIKSLTTDEIVAVLGHELGHFKLKHITKKMIFLIPLEFVIFFVLYLVSQSTLLYSGFGFDMINLQNVGFVQFLGIFLASMIYSSLSEILSPLKNAFSRRDEFKADEFSAKITGNSRSLCTALLKLNSENLSELLPPKIYVWWNFDHPSLTERIAALKKIDGEK